MLAYGHGHDVHLEFCRCHAVLKESELEGHRSTGLHSRLGGRWQGSRAETRGDLLTDLGDQLLQGCRACLELLCQRCVSCRQ